jgi:hypothetical protein
VRDAVRRGDLVLPPGVRPEVVTFGLWALMFGAFMLAELHRPDGVLGVTDPVDAIRACWRAQMDGLGWRPVSADEPTLGAGDAAPAGRARAARATHPRGRSTASGRSTRGNGRNGRAGAEEQR